MGTSSGAIIRGITAAVVAVLLACEPASSVALAVEAPPGAEEYSAELRERLGRAVTSKGADYRPRTRHLREDGSAKFTNRLVLESSPYLLQHAHNPVNWYPWGDEAFETAKRLGRPVLLSIGYSTCHWCHVMEEESFEDLEIATFLNDNYIAIKVDREERPDLDAIYMRAVQMLTGRGGWPMTTWLTPEREPFFGGTYFPARDGDRGARSGFLTVLRQLKQNFDAQPEGVAENAQKLAARIRRSMQPTTPGNIPGVETLVAAAEAQKATFDSVWGGRRGRPKFPSGLPLRALLRQHRRSADPELLEMVERTLSKMADGGMYDQVGGGFHRYSTDDRWLVPHFEKMLYDNALLTVAYLEGFQATGRERYATVAREILRYVAREMTSPDGAFYSATDADSPTAGGESEEGIYFTWTPAELRAVLGADDASRVVAYYGVSAAGNFEGRSILHVARPLDEVAKLLGIEPESLAKTIHTAREKLYVARAGRRAPLRDGKILTAWNGLMISAMARGGFVLSDPEFVKRAERAADFALQRLRHEGRLLRTATDDEARHPAYLDDYAFLMAGLLDLFEVTSDARWISETIALQGVLDAHYPDSKNGGYFMTSDDHEQLVAREKPFDDGAEPSGNSVALLNLLRLHELTTDDRYRKSAEGLLRGFASGLRRSPAGLSELLVGLDFWLDTPKEIVIVTPSDAAAAEPFLNVLRNSFLPNKVVVVTSTSVADAGPLVESVPWIRGKIAGKGRVTAYVCERGVCQRPTSDVDLFRAQLVRATTSSGVDATR